MSILPYADGGGYFVVGGGHLRADSAVGEAVVGGLHNHQGTTVRALLHHLLHSRCCLHLPPPHHLSGCLRLTEGLNVPFFHTTANGATRLS